ncbi:MAG TPA: hypothetical protein VGR47_07845 [Terracidiphilus sp.]|nr:hypothetical protein [Terracidiphilus sp.]
MAPLLVILTVAAFGMGIFTPPRSGPFCTGPCIAYPYADAAQFVPRDFFWMAPGILLTPVFIVLAACIHACVEERKKHLAVISLCFASISAALITLDYFIQMQVVQPSLLHAESNGLAIFSQYNPHGLFIALEDLGYLMLSLAFAFVSVAFPLVRGVPGTLRLIFLGGALFLFVSFIGLFSVYRLEVGFLFEITVITIDWTVLIVSGTLLTVYFRRLARPHLGVIAKPL